MACRKYPPFYEVEQNGVCVKNPPKVAADTSKDYILTGVLFALLFGGLIYAVNSATKS